MDNMNLRQMLEQLPLPYLLADRELRILWRNPCLQEHYPYLNLSNTLDGLLYGYEKEQLLERLEKTREALTLGCRLPMVELSLTLSPLKETEEILVALTPAPRGEEQKKDILTSFNKTLRAPISGLLGSISLLNHHLDEEYLPQLQSMSRDCYRMLRACISISEYSEYVNGTAVLDLQAHDLCDYLRQQLEPVVMMLRHMGIQLTYELPEEAVTLLFDEERLSVVLFSLLSNSCYFGENNNHIHLSLTCNEKYAKITIRDQGYGIPIEKLSKVMEPYFSMGLDEEDRPGLGLGLPLSKAIIEQHRGSFALQSVQDQGTVVIFSLPLDRDDGKTVFRAKKARYGLGPYSKRNIFLSTVLPAVEYE